jgi:hypothetical protein
MIEKTGRNDHERVSLLLPWFVNNTLDHAEREVVRLHLTDCVECQDEVSLLSSVQSAALKSSPTPIVPNADVTKLLHSIDNNGTNRSARTLSRPVIAFAASLATALLAVSVILVYQNQTEEPRTRFETATSAGQVAAMDYVLSVKFAAGTAAADRDAIWQAIGARNIAPAEVEGVYRVTVNLRVSKLEELKNYTQDVESLPAIQSVEVVAMQLPLDSPK